MMRLLGLVRYRFFLYAGLLPYLLGAAWARGMEGVFQPGLFWLGLSGILLSVIGVEAFNEYFDSRLGTDRVFDPEDGPPVAGWVLWLGLSAFAGAGAIGVRLAWLCGWPVLLYAGLGGLAAAFYVGPPIRWAYRGMGEAMISLSYGPWMTLGSLYLHSRAFSWGALAASLVPGLLIAALAGSTRSRTIIRTGWWASATGSSAWAGARACASTWPWPRQGWRSPRWAR